MKRKILITAITSASLLCLAGCSEEANFLEKSSNVAAGGDGTVTVKIGVSMPETGLKTKALGETPEINNLMLAVFDEAGYLTEYVEATADEYPSTNGKEGKKAYEATLKLNENVRSVHFIANGPESVASFGSEEEIIGTMTSYLSPAAGQLGPDMYWQKITLPKGVIGEYLNDEYVPDESVSSAMASVGLIRNFAKFEIKSTTEDFELVNASIVNVADRGYVAPYDRAKGAFVTDYATKGVDGLAAAGYTGAVPPTAELLNDVAHPTTGVASSEEGIYGNVVTTYAYEREKPSGDEAPVYVVVGGYYKDATELCYYKINLQDNTTSEYYPIFRNFKYTVNITEVAAAGMSNAGDASSSSGTGDISINSSYNDLTAISNGDSKLEVEYTELVVVDAVATTHTLTYKFVSDIANSTAGVYHWKCGDEDSGYNNSTDYVEISVSEPGAASAAISSISVIPTDNSYDNTSHWGEIWNTNGERAISFTTTPAGTTVKSQIITITGKRIVYVGANPTEVTIKREIKVVVRPPFDADEELDPGSVYRVVGQVVDVNLNLPQGLPSSIFPLYFNIEAEDLTLSPNEGDLTVVSGNSIIPNSTRRSSYHFVKTINWSEYYLGNNIYNTLFPIKFKTNCENSATTVYVTNEYFNVAHCALGNKDNEVYSKLADGETWYTTYEAAENHVAEDQPTTLTAKAKFVTTNGSLSFMIVDGSGVSQTVKGTTDGTKDSDGYMTFTATATIANPGTATVTATAEDTMGVTGTSPEKTVIVWKAVTTTREVTKDVEYKTLGTKLSSASFSTSTDYVIYNKSRSKYLDISGTSFAVQSYTDVEDAAADESLYFRFGSTSSTCYVKNVSGSRYIKLSRSGNKNYTYSATYSETSQNLTISYSTSGFTFSGSNARLYMSGTATVAATSTSTTNYAYWDIYPVVTATREETVEETITTYVEP